MTDRRCPKCHRLQSQHPGMKFASRDLNCRCMDCVRGLDTTPSGDVSAPKAADVKIKHTWKTPGNHDRTRVE